MKKMLSLMAVIAAITMAPGCCWCRKQEVQQEPKKEGRVTGPQQHLSEEDMK